MTRVLRLAAPVALLFLAACGPAASPEQAGRNQELLDEVADRVGSGAGVREVSATYVDDVENEAKAAVRVRCESCDIPALIDSAVRAVWASEVTPLLAISVSVQDLEQARSDGVSLSVRTDEAELIDSYGDRPVPSLPGDG